MKGGVGGQAAAGASWPVSCYRHPENKQSGLETGCLGQSEVMSQRNTAARTQPQGPLSPEHPMPPRATPEDHTSLGPPLPAPMTLTDYLFAPVL